MRAQESGSESNQTVIESKNPAPSCPPAGGARLDCRSAPGYDGTVIAAMSAGFRSRAWKAGPAEPSRSPRKSTRPSTNRVTTDAPGREPCGSRTNTSLAGGHNGPFAGWVFGPGLAVSAGQPSSWAGADQFRATVWFRSASASADGSNIEIDLGSESPAMNATQICRWRTRPTVKAVCSFGQSGPWIDRPVPPDHHPRNGHTRNQWHRLDIVANFHDGPANDTVENALMETHSPIPTAAPRSAPMSAGSSLSPQPYVLSNRLFFRSNFTPSDISAHSTTRPPRASTSTT